MLTDSDDFSLGIASAVSDLDFSLEMIGERLNLSSSTVFRNVKCDYNAKISSFSNALLPVLDRLDRNVGAHGEGTLTDMKWEVA